jgi:hypothetical protein
MITSFYVIHLSLDSIQSEFSEQHKLLHWKLKQDAITRNTKCTPPHTHTHTHAHAYAHTHITCWHILFFLCFFKKQLQKWTHIPHITSKHGFKYYDTIQFLLPDMLMLYCLNLYTSTQGIDCLMFISDTLVWKLRASGIVGVFASLCCLQRALDSGLSRLTCIKRHYAEWDAPFLVSLPRCVIAKPGRKKLLGRHRCRRKNNIKIYLLSIYVKM